MKSQAGHSQAAEMRFAKHVAGYILQGRKRNFDVRQELNIMSLLDRNRQYRLKWLEILSE